jgi:hypothetical protein
MTPGFRSQLERAGLNSRRALILWALECAVLVAVIVLTVYTFGTVPQ